MGLSVGITEVFRRLLNSGIEFVGLGELNHGENELLFEKINDWGKLFSGIFLEIPVNYQNAVNEYLITKKFNKDFEGLLQGAKAEGKSLQKTLSLIMDFASGNNLPVVCVDSSKIQTSEYKTRSKFSYGFLKSDSRDGDMYLNILDVMKKQKGKWFFLGGAAHLDYTFSIYDGKPSLGKRLKKELHKTMFTVLLMSKTNMNKIQYFPTDELPKDLALPIPGLPNESFDAVIIHG